MSEKKYDVEALKNQYFYDDYCPNCEFEFKELRVKNFELCFNNEVVGLIACERFGNSVDRFRRPYIKYKVALYLMDKNLAIYHFMHGFEAESLEELREKVINYFVFKDAFDIVNDIERKMNGDEDV